MTLLNVGISCIIVGFGLSSLSFYEVKDGLKFIFEERSKINKVAFFFTIFEYVTGIFMFGILLILFGIFAILMKFFETGLDQLTGDRVQKRLPLRHLFLIIQHGRFAELDYDHLLSTEC